jgi:putative tricarboxylic transport membrane protein
VAQIGQDGIHAHGRFTFGWTDLSGGFQLIPALVGAFGFAEVLTVMKERMARPQLHAVDSVLPRIGDVIRHWKTVLRSGVIGVYVGILPGVGEDMAAWSSYAAAKRASKEPEKYGKGSVEGLIAAETGDNASIPGAIIPALALAIPGSAPAAVLLAAIIIHGIRPGPMLMVETPQVVYDIVTMNIFATLGILFFGLFLIRPLLLVLRIPRNIIMPIIFVLCTVGAFAITQRVFDIYVMLFFGLVGFILRELKFPMPPLILGLVLGELLEQNLTRGLVISSGDVTPFFTRPVSGVLAAVTIFAIVWSIPPAQRKIKAGLRGLFRRGRPQAG